MYKQILKHILPFTLMLGVFLIAFNIFKIDNITVLSQRTINYGSYTWEFYYLDVGKYLQNLQAGLETLPNIEIIPTMPVFRTPQSWQILDILKFLANTLFIYITNMIVWVLQIILFVPFKLLLYPLNIIYSILGLNTSDNEWISAVYKIYALQIPKIPYI